MIGEFKFFSKNNSCDVLKIASMTNIDGVQYRRIIYNEYGDKVQRVNMGGVFPFSGDEYEFTWIDTTVIGDGYYSEGEPTTTTAYHGSLPNFLMHYSHAKIFVYRIDCHGEMFFSHNCIDMYHFTNAEPYRDLTIHAIVI